MKPPLLLLSLALTWFTVRSEAQPTLPEPGPETDGLRLRFKVSPERSAEGDGYRVRVDIINTSRDDAELQLKPGRSDQATNGFKEHLEAAVSIGTWPAIEPWLGQFMVAREGTPAPSSVVKPGESLVLEWRTTGSRLKNRVTNPLEVQNPEFHLPGLYSVHATLAISRNGRMILLRSNEQLVTFGNSREAPKHTYGQLWSVDENMRTATLGLGALQKTQPGDLFRIQSGVIGKTWTLTITNVQPDHSIGTVEPAKENPPSGFPSRGMHAALILNQ